jgi:hypothetical protein
VCVLFSIIVLYKRHDIWINGIEFLPGKYSMLW